MDINLLPPSDRQRLATPLRAKRMPFYILLVILIGVIFIGALTLFRTMLVAKSSETEVAIRDTLNETRLSEYKKVEEQIASVNALFGTIKSLRGQRILWFDDFEHVLSLIPPEIHMRGFEFDTQKQAITIFGYAPLREQVTTLEQRLKKVEGYILSEAPLSNITSREDVNFSFQIQRIEAFVQPAKSRQT